MKKLTIAAAIAAAMLASPAMAKDYSSIKIATEGAYKPWNFKDSSGKLVGFELDLIEDLCKRMNTKCEVVEQAWDGIIPSLTAGKYDAIIAGMSITDKRKKKITFSRSYVSTPGYMVVMKSSSSAKLKVSMDAVDLNEVSAGEKAVIAELVKEFKGKTIGVQTATTHENFLREYLGSDADIKSYDTQENLDLDLQAGRVDAALASMAYWDPLLKSDKGKDLMSVGPNLTGGPFGHGVGVGIRKEDQALADKFSKAIEASVNDGTVSKLAVQWFGFDNATR
jgi:octopine/nopaline transport system substrate-binding protein